MKSSVAASPVRQRHLPEASAGMIHSKTSLEGGPYGLSGTGTLTRSSGCQSSMSNSWETMRVPGFSSFNSRGRNCRFTRGK